MQPGNEVDLIRQTCNKRWCECVQQLLSKP